MRRAALLLAPALALAASPARASELFGGLLVHDIDTPLTKGGRESGLDLQLGWRGRRIGALGFIGLPRLFFVARRRRLHPSRRRASASTRRALFARPGIGNRHPHPLEPGVAGGIRRTWARASVRAESVCYQLSERVAGSTGSVAMTVARRQESPEDSIGGRLTSAA